VDKSKHTTNRRNFLKTAVAGAAATAMLPFGVGSADGQTAPPIISSIASGELDEITVDALRKGLDSGKFTSRQLVEMYLVRIAELDRGGPSINSVIEANPDALNIADALDEERRAKGAHGLHGIPVLIKDNVGTADKMQTTAGSLALMDARPAKDSFVAARLRTAGAIILGKTNLSEWANFRSNYATSGWSGRGGLTLNPYVLDRNPSGSSSGSAVAVAASLCPLAVGTETDGSIVSPASCCGIVGIKPTVGLVSRAGIVPISHTQDTAGPMARTVADAAALLNAMVGIDPDDKATAEANGKMQQDYTQFLLASGLRGARIGVVRKYAKFNDEVDKLLAQAIAAMKSAGAEIIDPVEISTIGKFGDAEMEVLLYEFKDDLNKYLGALGPNATVHSLKEAIEFNEKHRREEMPYFGQDIFKQAEAKGPLTSKSYLKALEQCRKMSRKDGIDAVMSKQNLDALVAPTNSPACVTDLVDGDRSPGSCSSLAAVAGYPHITVPMGFVFGLPVGVSFFGRAWSEPTLIKLAYSYEHATRLRKAPKFLRTADLKM
jgi:amidase